MKKVILFFMILCLPFTAISAAEDIYQFSSPQQEQRFTELTSQLRCLVCQNQNLAESNSGLASDLRDQVYQHIQKGQTDKEIIDYLVMRYGNFILYKPPFSFSTAGLWLGPFSILIIGLGYLFFYIRKIQRGKTND